MMRAALYGSRIDQGISGPPIRGHEEVDMMGPEVGQR
jgi:hypothetical protein